VEQFASYLRGLTDGAIALDCTNTTTFTLLLWLALKPQDKGKSDKSSALKTFDILRNFFGKNHECLSF
jgi:hypothetical protein